MSRDNLLLTLFYSLTVFVSAFLLFVVQPMASSMVLPHLGGSSMVWTTCMLFFQTMLLTGYLYAHGLTELLRLRSQFLVHGLLILVAFLFLPINVPGSMLQTGTTPAWYLLAALFFGIGLPMLVVSSSAPLFQHWYGQLDHPHADDPYYLYAASNAGSMIALLSYPFLIDRFTSLTTQSYIWTVGFGLLTILMGFCGYSVYKDGRVTGDDSDGAPVKELSYRRIIFWITYTFVPSSLMLGLTHYITTDLASVPLLWVLPLAAYLLSFILVFARLEHPLWLYRWSIPPSLILVFALTFYRLLSYPVLIGLHMVCFVMVCIFCHGTVARDRPKTGHLTKYYIFVALGGSLGGLFNALLAPVLFNSTVEYYLVYAILIVLSGWRVSRWNEDESLFFDTLYVALAAVSLLYYLWSPFGLEPSSFYTLVLLATFSSITLIVAFLIRPRSLNLVIGVLFFLGYWYQENPGRLLAKERSFYGQYRVLETDGPGRAFMHGTTTHGYQRFENGELVNEPTGYYHPDGPMGDIALAFNFDRVGIGGLGVGGLSAYAGTGDRFHFFEIDPVVETLAREYFEYLEGCGQRCRVQTGDARKLIESKSPRSFDLIIMDAYSSDAIPTHLLTKEAVKIYLSRVKRGGVVVFHVSNRHLSLEGVIGAIAHDIGAVAMTNEYYPPLTKTEPSASTYVVMARKDSVLKPLKRFQNWQYTKIGSTLWTDNYTSIVSVLATDESIPDRAWDELDNDLEFLRSDEKLLPSAGPEGLLNRSDQELFREDTDEEE